MAFSGNFGKIDPRFYFEDFKMNLGLFFPNWPQTHAITIHISHPSYFLNEFETHFDSQILF